MNDSQQNSGIEVYRQNGLRIVDRLETIRIDMNHPLAAKRYGGVNRTVSGQECECVCTLYDIFAQQDAYLMVLNIVWDNGERDVRAIEVAGPDDLLSLGSGRLRLAVQELEHSTAGNLYSILRQARIKQKPSKRSNLYKATVPELNQGAGIDVPRTLLEAGAIKVGTKKNLLGCMDQTQEMQCVIFPRDNELIPVLAFVLTRVCPLIKEYPAR